MKIEESLIIVPYDPRWQAAFEEEKKALEGLFSDEPALVEHIGSTAVPGLGARPVIDLMLGVWELAAVDARLAGIQKLGYRLVPWEGDGAPDLRFFFKARNGAPSHRLHAVVMGEEFWFHHLLFRDYLRAHASVAREYYEAKMGLAERFKNDPKGYSEGKLTLFKQVLGRAEGGFCTFCC